MRRTGRICPECEGACVSYFFLGEFQGSNGVWEEDYEERPCEYCDGRGVITDENEAA